MDFTELIKNRYSVRAYQDIPVEPWKVTQILESGRLAPTAANRQAFQILVVSTGERRQELLGLYNREWFVQAPLILGICIRYGGAWTRHFDGKNYAVVDAAIVMDHMILAATSLGLGTCWIAAFDPQAAKDLFAIPDDLEPVIFTPIGYAADTPKTKDRKPLSDLVKYIT